MTTHGEAQMDINSLTIGQARELAAMFASQVAPQSLDCGLNGKYVIVRCKDAGVHAGVLVSHSGRECVLKDSRRLWYWKPANGQKYLSGVATAGLDSASKIGAPLSTLYLSENCEIIECSPEAEKSIRGAKTDEK